MKTWTRILDSTNAELIEWASAQDWAHAMASCQQDASWHAEGDVWTHVRMVCDSLIGLDAWPALERNAQIQLLFTAFLHDSGKPATTQLDPTSGRVRAPKHALVGAGIARRVLRELGCPLEQREEIVGLVRYHGRPPYLLEKPSPESTVIETSWFANNRLLHLFALADGRGRSSLDPSEARSEDALHLWRMVAEERHCLDAPYHFANDHARFLFFRNELGSLHYTPHHEPRATVTLLSGLPGSGKDTWLAQHRPALPVVSLDAIRTDLDVAPTDEQGSVIQEARERCREHLRAGRDFAFNATNITRQTRQRWINLFHDYGARIEIVYLEPALETILARNSRRQHPVPTQVILHLADRLEPPTAAECHGLTLVGEPPHGCSSPTTPLAPMKP